MHIHTSPQPSLELGFGDYTINWGTHICGLFENDRERDEIIFNILHRGNEAGDIQLYAPYEISIEHFHQKFDRDFPCCAGHSHDPNRFGVFASKDVYYPDGSFSPWKMDDNLGALFTETQKNGHRNVRGIAEMLWALEDVPGVEDLMAYESRLNYFVEGKPWVSLCMYNLTKFSGSVIMEVLRTHPYSITGGVIMENPYFVKPDIWLAENAPQYLGRK